MYLPAYFAKIDLTIMPDAQAGWGTEPGGNKYKCDPQMEELSGFVKVDHLSKAAGSLYGSIKPISYLCSARKMINAD
jgi:hypothetical protein